MADLLKVMADLYDREINCGIRFFYDGGFTVAIGDDLNGRHAEKEFRGDQLNIVAHWLKTNSHTPKQP
jgi:hypothetical protein